MALDIKDCIITENVSFKDLTSFKTGGKAPLLIEPKSREGLAEAVRTLCGTAYRVMGNGSNLLVSDSGIKEPVIRLGRSFSKIEVQGGNIICQAGALLSSAAHAAYKNSLTGMEFAHGIPGSLGGAVRMNAGAYGGEMKDIVDSVEYIDQSGVFHTISGTEAGFSYRKSFFSDKDLIVSSVTLKLKKGDGEAILARMKELGEKRRTKQPLEYPSAGSTFKRPNGYFAAALIEEAGLKGVKVGGAEVSEKHAGFVINKDNAETEDVLALIEKIKRTVFEKSGVTLETEVEIWK